MNIFHECEMKFFMNDDIIVNNITRDLLNLKFSGPNEMLQTDYIFDNNGFLRENGVLLRLRSQIMNDEEVFLTVKIKGNSRFFQDNMEYETSLSKYNITMIQNINEILKKRINVILPNSIIEAKNVLSIESILNSIGLITDSVIQKKRKEFSCKNVKVLIDKFPRIKGFYIEVEADCEENLFDLIKRLNLDMALSDKRNYGQIIAEMTNNTKKLIFEN